MTGTLTEIVSFRLAMIEDDLVWLAGILVEIETVLFWSLFEIEAVAFLLEGTLTAIVWLVVEFETVMLLLAITLSEIEAVSFRLAMIDDDLVWFASAPVEIEAVLFWFAGTLAVWF